MSILPIVSHPCSVSLYHSLPLALVFCVAQNHQTIFVPSQSALPPAIGHWPPTLRIPKCYSEGEYFYETANYLSDAFYDNP